MNFDLPPFLAIGLALLVLVGGPWYLISNAVERRRLRKAIAYRAENAEYLGEELLYELGPLRTDEMRKAYRNIARFIASAGVVTEEQFRWSVMQARVEAAAYESEEAKTSE